MPRCPHDEPPIVRSLFGAPSSAAAHGLFILLTRLPNPGGSGRAAELRLRRQRQRGDAAGSSDSVRMRVSPKTWSSCSYFTLASGGYTIRISLTAIGTEVVPAEKFRNPPANSRGNVAQRDAAEHRQEAPGFPNRKVRSTSPSLKTLPATAAPNRRQSSGARWGTRQATVVLSPGLGL